jgi:hypothetical protein
MDFDFSIKTAGFNVKKVTNSMYEETQDLVKMIEDKGSESVKLSFWDKILLVIDLLFSCVVWLPLSLLALAQGDPVLNPVEISISLAESRFKKRGYK